jgi:hypothetical protein
MVTGLSLLGALVLLLLGVASVTAQVNDASGNVRAVFPAVAMPIVIGMRQAGQRRLEFGWGALVTLVLPFVIGQSWAMWHLASKRSSR